MRRLVSRMTSACQFMPALTGLAVLLTSTAIAYGQEGSAPLARYFPRDDLVVYAEFDGIDAHAAAWKATAAAKILNETKTGSMLESLVSQVADKAMPSVGTENKVTGADLLAIVEHAFHSGFAFGITRKQGQQRPSCVALVLRGAAQETVRGPLGRLIKSDDNAGSKTVAKPGGRQIVEVGQKPGWAWWAEQNDMVLSLASAQGADAIIEVLEGKQPSAVGHPLRAELSKRENGFQPVGLAYFEMAAIPTLPPQAAALGLDRIVRLDYRWGFQDDALITVTRLVAPAPRRGILTLLDQPTFDAKSLPPIPSDLNDFAVLSLDPDRFYARITALVEASDANAQTMIEAFERSVLDATGQRLREDILGHLGPKMAYYVVPTKGYAPTNPISGFVGGLVRVSKSILLVEIDDPAAVGKVLDALVARANQVFKAQAGGGPATAAEFLPLKGPQKGYALSVPPAAGPIPAGMRPTVIVGQKYLVLGTTPEAARSALAVQNQSGSVKPADKQLANVFDHLPASMTFLSVSDTRESLLPEVIANLPGLVQMIGSGTTPFSFASGFQMFGGPRFAPPPRGGRGFQLKMEPDEIPTSDEVREYLFPAMFALSVDDQGFRLITRESFPGLNPAALAPVALAVTLPAVQASRAAARRAQSTNNLKQIGLAIHNHVSSFDHMPAPASKDKNGKPLLSWRVALLPFIEQQALFNEFKLDEPWDSPHNQALLERMPATYAVPGSKAEPGFTFYRGFLGRGTIFDPTVKDGVSFNQVTDGTSNTIAVVEAKEAVPWTKPDSDIPFESNAKPEEAGNLVPLLGGHFPGGFNALFLDGSVRFIRETINSLTLRALITRDGGEIISSDSF